MKFLDEAKIYVQSGHGGAGAVAFRREKFIEYGGPNGGNGGKGGDVWFEAADNLNTLIDYRYAQHFKAQRGGHGMGQNRTGRGGEDVTLMVPVGTQVLDEDRETVLLDLVTNGQRVLFLKGGVGGLGNDAFKSSTNRAPTTAQPGMPGEERTIWLRLKLVADIGIVGLPNAGKSTFLAATTAAKPKIADYPFTTLVPNLGVVRGPAQYGGEIELVLADIPGLIEGASEGQGLGDRFLGHVERTASLLHLVDATQDDPVAAYKTIRAELKAYGQGLARKKEILVLTKADALTPQQAAKVQKQLETASRRKVQLISAVSGAGVPALLGQLSKLVAAAKAAKKDAESVIQSD